jgi:hypothetical protein
MERALNMGESVCDWSCYMQSRIICGTCCVTIRRLRQLQRHHWAMMRHTQYMAHVIQSSHCGADANR